MTYQFICKAGHVTDLKFRTIGAAIAHFDDPNNTDTYDGISCPKCSGKTADRVYGNTATLFYGSDWDKPAPSGRTSTVGSDPTKRLTSMGPPTDKAFLGRR